MDQTHSAAPSTNFPIWWKKWWISLSSGSKIGRVCISSSEVISLLNRGHSQTCPSDWVTAETRGFCEELWPKSFVRARSNLCTYTHCPNYLIRGASHRGEWREDHADRCCRHLKWVVCDSSLALVAHQLYTRNCPCCACWCRQSSRCVIYIFSWRMISCQQMRE